MKQPDRNVSSLGNEARHAFVRNQITKATLTLLDTKPIHKISIYEICATAEVGRVSFYRNFESKEDVVQKHIFSLIRNWKERNNEQSKDSNAEMYGSLFSHLKENADFYLLLKRQNLMHLFLNVFIELCGARAEDDNMWAYTKSFIAYGTYGWIEEWLARGMQESAETMAALLTAHGVK